MDFGKLFGKFIYAVLIASILLIAVALMYSIMHIGDDPYAQEDMQESRRDIDGDRSGGEILNLRDRVLMVSDLPDGRLNVTKDIAKCHLVLADGNVTRVYNSIREEQGVIVCRVASDEYLLDKQGNEIVNPSSASSERMLEYLDKQIVELKNDKELTEKERARRILFMEIEKRHAIERPGFRHISVEHGRVYDHDGSEVIVIGEL